MTTTMIDASRQKGAYTVYVDWSTNDADKDVSVVVHIGNKTISLRNTERLAEESASVNCTQNSGGNAYLANNNTPQRISNNDIPVVTYSASVRTFVNQDLIDFQPIRDEIAAAPIDQPLFHLLVAEDNSVGHYERRGISGGWKRVDRLLLPAGQHIPDSAISHIQSFTAPEHLNALALLQPSNSLVAFEYNPATGDHHPIPVDVGGGVINGIPALVQSDEGFFHLLVPLLNQDHVQGVVHLIHPNQTIQGPLKSVATLPPLAQGDEVVSIALVQTDAFGSLKAVVRVQSTNGMNFLKSYQSDPKFTWQGPFDLPVINDPFHDTIRNVAGSPGMVQSIFGDQEQLDLIVPIMDEQTRTVTLTHFTQPAGEGTSINHPWTQVATLLPLNNDPHMQVVSTSIFQDSNRDLQNIAHVISNGLPLLAFYIFDPQTGWSTPTPVTDLDGKPIIVGRQG